MPRNAGDAAARMCSRAANIETRDRRTIVGEAGRRAHGEDLVHMQAAMEDIATDEAEFTLEIERSEHLAGDDRTAEIRRIRRHRVDHALGGFVPRFVPASPVGERRREMLAKQACHVMAFGCQRRVDGRGDAELDNGFARNAMLARLVEGAIQIGK